MKQIPTQPSEVDNDNKVMGIREDDRKRLRSRIKNASDVVLLD